MNKFSTLVLCSFHLVVALLLTTGNWVASILTSCSVFFELVKPFLIFIGIGILALNPIFLCFISKVFGVDSFVSIPGTYHFSGLGSLWPWVEGFGTQIYFVWKMTFETWAISPMIFDTGRVCIFWYSSSIAHHSNNYIKIILAVL